MIIHPSFARIWPRLRLGGNFLGFLIFMQPTWSQAQKIYEEIGMDCGMLNKITQQALPDYMFIQSHFSNISELCRSDKYFDVNFAMT